MWVEFGTGWKRCTLLGLFASFSFAASAIETSFKLDGPCLFTKQELVGACDQMMVQVGRQCHARFHSSGRGRNVLENRRLRYSLEDGMLAKILYGQLQDPDHAVIVGGHSNAILDNPDVFEVISVHTHENGVQDVWFRKKVKVHGEVVWSEARQSTLPPADWTDQKIVEAIVATAPDPRVIKLEEKKSIHLHEVEGVHWVVYKEQDVTGRIVAAYPIAPRRVARYRNANHAPSIHPFTLPMPVSSTPPLPASTSPVTGQPQARF